MNLLIFDSEKSWVGGVTTFWLQRLAANPSLKICLPSGMTPKPIYRAVGQEVKDRRASFARARIIALDEYGGLAADDPGRCRNMLQEDLLKDLDLPLASLCAFVPENNPEEERARFERTIGNGLDVVLLGLGVNGHLGLNEPGSKVDSGIRRMELHPSTVAGSAQYLSHKNLPTWGLTLGLKEILAAREVWLIANGRHKAEIVQKVVSEKISESLPATLLRNHKQFYFFLDEAAAGLIR